MDKKSSGKKSWLMTSTFYGVVFSLVLAIFGVSAAIYNVAKVRKPLENEFTTIYSVPKSTTTEEHRANANADNIPDEREKTSRTTANDLNRPYSGYYLLPLNSKISKDYSEGAPVLSKTLGDWRTHDGIDITGNIGDNAIAIQDGTVKSVTSDELWGDVIVIEHGNGLTAKYCGIKANIKKDSRIEQGQVIGTVVAIPVEAADGVHVHLETEVNGKNVNPVKALNLMNEAVSLPE